jgi:hypothetical protein
MISCDTIIENGSLFIENLNTLATTTDQWVSGTNSNYSIYSFNYKKPLIRDHIYYFRFNYKYSTTNQRPTWVSLYADGGA